MVRHDRSLGLGFGREECMKGHWRASGIFRSGGKDRDIKGEILAHCASFAVGSSSQHQHRPEFPLNLLTDPTRPLSSAGMGVQLAAEQASLAEIGDVNFSDLELAYHVKDALRSVPLGDRDSYDQLVGFLFEDGERLGSDEVALLVTNLNALSGAVSDIDFVHHGSLLDCIFNMSLWKHRPDVMDALLELIIALAASSGKYVDSCLDMLVRNFMPPGYFLTDAKQRTLARKKGQVLDRVHSALKDIAELVPLAPLRLEQIIKDRVPIFNKEPLIVTYIENMLTLESGAMRELVGNSMLVEVVNTLIDLDVEIGWDDILQDDSSKGIFEMELDDEEGSADDDETDNFELPRGFSSQKMLKGNVVAEKLDSLMVLMFEHLQDCYYSGRLVQVFETLLQSFQSTVLTAYKSKFAQFVMFYACSLDPENCGATFANRLADLFKSPVYAQEWRMSAVAYLASYLSRAKFLSASYIVNILEREKEADQDWFLRLQDSVIQARGKRCDEMRFFDEMPFFVFFRGLSLADWCSSYCKSQCGEINPKAHRVFYAGCQAIMYVLCFRMRSILGVPRLKSQLFLMPIGAILTHPLNPLKVCLPSIVEEFLLQAKVARLFSCSEIDFHGLLESELSRAFGGLERLDMFFPFDPYLLKKSDRFIWPNFVYWSMVRTTCDNDDDDDDEGSIDEVIAQDCVGGNGVNVTENGTAMSFDEDYLDGFDNSMMQMSITPKNYKFGSALRGGMQMPSRIRPSTSPESL
ncbi:hypothetical protein RJ639_034337 [Escallonia herrerae]|uniref:RNA polymerase I-specific transcription initiation factor RRN3 n=1 Tax=Escallonia herrerae TaxID=1293975 RepID=A0AA88WU81_9ASTE|nr:hypothetical protein RJ639_034337 [Escallonia herrerae]